jgi:hypothetical protein
MKNHIGKIISFDESGFERTKRFFENKLIPALNEVKEAFEKLEIGPFTEQVYQAVVNSGLSEIKERYDQVLNSEVSKLKSPTLSKRIAELLTENPPIEDLQKAWANVLNIGAAEINHISQPTIDYSFCTFNSKKKEWVIDYDCMKKYFENVIETEQQSGIYNRLLQFQELHKELRNEISQLPRKENKYFNNPQIVTIMSDQHGDGLIYEDNQGEAHLDLNYFVNLFNQ